MRTNLLKLAAVLIGCLPLTLLAQPPLPDLPPLDANEPMAPATEQMLEQGPVYPDEYTAWEGEMLEGDIADGFCESCGGKLELFGLFAPSDRAFDKFISPVSNPILFEDPRTLTEFRPIFINHVIPGDNLLAGGDVQAYQGQIRLALSERFSLIATEAGLLDVNPHALPHDSGFSDVTAGFKYNIIRDPARQLIVSGGSWYQIPMGDQDVFQARGDGVFHGFLTGGKEFCCHFHCLYAGGIVVPVDHNENSQYFWFSSHVDAELWENVYALLETHWFHYSRGGTVSTLTDGFEGTDVFNFGSTGVTNDVEDGQDIVTMAIGSRVKFWGNNEAGIAWEFPLSENLGPLGERNRILNNRLLLDAIFRY